MTLSAGKFWGLRRLADADGRFKLLAVDQRPPLEQLIRERRGGDVAPYDDVAAVKRELLDALAGHASATLLDPHVAYPLGVARLRPTGGLVLTLEDSLFRETPGGRLSAAIDDWSVAKIKRAGGDAVKVLAWYRPDADAAVCAQQQRFVRDTGDACRRYDIPFVFELRLYPLPGEHGQTRDCVEQPQKRAEHVLQSVDTFADPAYGVDLFKLESPLPAAQLPDPDDADEERLAAIRAAQEAFNTLGRLAGRPWVLLAAGARPAAFERLLGYAYRAGASGYLAGRAIWWEAFQRFPDLAAMRAELDRDAVACMRRLNALTDAAATRWHQHPCYGDGGARLAGAGAGFRHRYPDFSASSDHGNLI